MFSPTKISTEGHLLIEGIVKGGRERESKRERERGRERERERERAKRFGAKSLRMQLRAPKAN